MLSMMRFSILTQLKLYSDIDSQVNGLGATLQEALESASK